MNELCYIFCVHPFRFVIQPYQIIKGRHYSAVPYAHVTTSAQKEAAQTMGNILSM